MSENPPSGRRPSEDKPGEEASRSPAQPRPDIERLRQEARNANPEPLLNPSNPEPLIFNFVNTSIRDILTFAGNATLVTGGQEDAVRLWNAATGEAVAALRGHVAWVRSVAASADGKAILSGRVHSWAERKSVVAAARFTPGVHGVEDRLVVQPA